MNMKENKLPFELVQRFAESILQGNAIYNQLAMERKLSHIYLNIPEAMITSAHITGNIEEWVSLTILFESMKYNKVRYPRARSSTKKIWRKFYLLRSAMVIKNGKLAMYRKEMKYLLC